MRAAGWIVLVMTTQQVVMAATADIERPCEDIVGLLRTEFIYKTRHTQPPRVEIRQCEPR